MSETTVWDEVSGCVGFCKLTSSVATIFATSTLSTFSDLNETVLPDGTADVLRSTFPPPPVASNFIDGEFAALDPMIVLAFCPGANSVEDRGGIAPISTLEPLSSALPVLRTVWLDDVRLFRKPERRKAL